jgi:ceramide glucosyltransferase
VLLNTILGCLALLSLSLTLWQWYVARRFPLNQRVSSAAFAPEVSLLKPLKGFDSTTESCLRSWFTQDYSGPVQILFGVASAEDPVCPVVRGLMQQFPTIDAQLRLCGPLPGANLKVCKLAELEQLAKYEVLVISDADVLAPPDLLANVVARLQAKEVGLVNCFYRLANPVTPAMQWEAVAINADFWGQVLQSQSLKPLDFALGAVMATRRKQLAEIGGFAALQDCLADDYLLGNRIARRGHRVDLCPVVVECWSGPMRWRDVWQHQLRWARTIRVCQPVPYFFSILGNATLWPLLWAAIYPAGREITFALCFWLARIGTALNLQQLLTGAPAPMARAWLVPVKDLLQAALWLLSFLGNRVEWRGQKMRLRRDGTLVRDGPRRLAG